MKGSHANRQDGQQMGERQIQRLISRLRGVDAPYTFEEGVKIGVGGDCPGVVGGERETISMAVDVSFWSETHGVLCKLTLVLITSDAVDVVQSMSCQGPAKLSPQAIADLMWTREHLTTQSARRWRFWHGLLLAGHPGNWMPMLIKQ
ncbi:unnamed protein product [Strongylus vulgaris]|uniref:Uncharacterized protein n=1 Tax=Strongylus vulgaris TaxID=40348 RepID=A0A3P7LYQ2_STRVU|nr:unnamed protein product [Strongylus vulgaris]